MTDKYRKRHVPLPSLAELLGEREGLGPDADVPSEDSASVESPAIGTDTGPDGVAADAAPAPKRQPDTRHDISGHGGQSDDKAAGKPDQDHEVDPADAFPSDQDYGDHRDAFEPNWYRVLAAQAKVRGGDGQSAEDAESPSAQ